LYASNVSKFQLDDYEATTIAQGRKREWDRETKDMKEK
jgi:hypothetical protein